MAIIDIKGLYKIYDTGKVKVEAVRDLSFNVDEGEFVAIMGPSGSGKSTLMNIIGCLDTPTSGRYVLDGQDISEFGDSEITAVRNRKIGFVFQSFNLLPRMNALKNVELPLVYARIPAEEREKRALAAIERVQLRDRIDHLPNELSGGQKQRLAIARALVGNPAIILADEPTGNLDSATSIDIMELFARLNREGATIILVTHEPDIAAYADRIITLRDGRITSDCPSGGLKPDQAQQALAKTETE